MCLSGFLLQEVGQIAERPGFGDWRARLARRTATFPSPTPAEMVRTERDRHRSALFDVLL